MYTLKNYREPQLWAQTFQVTGALVLLSGETWRTALKLQGRPSRRQVGKGKVKERRREQMWWYQRRCVKGGLSFIDYKERRDHCLLVQHRISHDSFICIWLHAGLIETHRLTHKSKQLFRWKYLFLLSSPHRNRAFLSTSVWCSSVLCKDSCVRSLQTNWHVYIAQRRDTDRVWPVSCVSMSEQHCQPWAIQSCYSLFALFPELCIALLCAMHMDLCIPTTTLELRACFFQPSPRSADGTTWLLIVQQILWVVGSGLLLRIMCWVDSICTALGYIQIFTKAE